MRTSLAVIAILAVLAAPLATSACAPRQASPAGNAAFDDATISTRVKTALLNDPDIGALRIDVSTVQGVVTLSGVARTRAEEQKAVQVARKIPGVRDVKSALQVK